MSAGRYDTNIEQGATWARTLTWKDSAGVSVDLTGYSGKMEVRQSHGGPVLATLSTAQPPGGITLGVQGTITLLLSANQTASLAPGDLAYDLILTSPSGVVTRLIEGWLHISAGITAGS